jgi:hypothetical protein
MTHANETRPPRLAVRLVPWMLLPLALWATVGVHQSPFGIAVRYAALLFLAGTLYAALRASFPDQDRVIHSVAPLFTLIWGHTIFNGYPWYDEIGRFAMPPLSVWLTTPINDHWEPWMYPIWFVQYRWWQGHYAGIAIPFYLAAIAGLTAFAAVIARFAAGLPGAQRRLLIWTALLIPHSWRLWEWKGCGDAPVVTFMWFALWLALLAARGRGLSWRTELGLGLLYVLTIGSSSMMTVAVVYALPLLWLPEYRRPAFLRTLAVAALLTALYWIARGQVVDTPLRTSPHLRDVPAALGSIWVQLARGRAFVATGVALLALLGAFRLARQSPPLRVLVSLGAALFIVGGAQLFGGRALSTATSAELSTYHMFLPFMGCALLIGVGLAAAGAAVPAAVTRIASVVMIAVFLWSQHGFHVATARAHDPVIRLRAEFQRDLAGLRGERIPDRSMATSRIVDLFDWCPRPLLEDPDQLHWGWRDRVRLSRLQGFVGGGLDLGSEREAARTPEVRAFLAKYWDGESMAEPRAANATSESGSSAAVRDRAR